MFIFSMAATKADVMYLHNIYKSNKLITVQSLMGGMKWIQLVRPQVVLPSVEQLFATR